MGLHETYMIYIHCYNNVFSAMLDRSFESFSQEIADLDKRNHAGIDTTLSEGTGQK